MTTSGQVILVCGGHIGIDPLKVSTWLIDNRDLFWPVRKVVEGGADGADRGGRMFAKALGIECITVNAEWDRYGVRAGPIRNERMLVEQLPDVVIAFPGKAGTRNMLKLAERYCVKFIYRPAGNFALEGRYDMTKVIGL